MDGGGAKSHQARDVVRRPCLRRLDDNRRVEPNARIDQVVVDGSDGDEGRDEGILSAEAGLLLVGQDDDLRASAHLELAGGITSSQVQKAPNQAKSSYAK